MTNEEIIWACAEAAHEVNRVYCAMLGDDSQRSWAMAEEWQRESAVAGVRAALEGGANPRTQHERWMRDKLAAGWRWGFVKDVDKREHPCMVEYDLLPEEQQAKDLLFLATVTGVSAHLCRAR